MYHLEDDLCLVTRCAYADSFRNLAQVALSELKKFKTGAEIVCGPITTGGSGNIDSNLKMFRITIDRLRAEGRRVFDQMPYEHRIFQLTALWKEAHPTIADQYHTPVLEGFYIPLFDSGRIVKGVFMPGWQSSRGAVWERGYLENKGIRIEDLAW